MIWYIFYGLGLAILIAGILLYFSKKKSENGAVLFILAAIFLTTFVWYIPIELSQGVYSFPEGVLSAILQGVGVLKADGYSKNTDGAWWVYSLYSISIMILRIAVLPMIFGLVLSFFRLPYQLILNFIREKRAPYIFVGISEKNILIAKSLYEKESCRLIFVSTKASDEENPVALKEIGALVFDVGFSYLLTKIVKDSKRFDKTSPLKIFVFEENEEKNLFLLQELVSVLKNDKSRNTRIFVEIENLSWTNQNHIQEGFKEYTGLTVNFVRSYESFAYNNLYNNKIDKYYIDDSGRRLIKVLIIGINRVSLEMIKSITWLMQIPGYRLDLCAVGSGNYIDEFKFSYPGIVMSIDEYGYASYNLNMYEGIDYKSERFKEIINDYSDFTFAFIGENDSVANLNLSEYLITVRKRMNKDNNFIIQLKNDKKIALDKGDDDPFNHIIEVGSLSEVYSYDFITNSALENAAELVHLERQSQKAEDKRVSWSEYCKDEYMRGSTLARVLGIRYKLDVIDSLYGSDYSLLKTHEWKEAEHMRWNIYTWFLGMIRGNETDRKIGKIHSDLKAFDKLEERIKKYDEIEINEEIASAVRTKSFNTYK